MKLVSVILPAYEEKDNILSAAATLSAVLKDTGLDYELLFVDDGSKDGTWERIREAGAADPRVRGVRFSRNFGKEAAMFAGLEAAGGDCCVVMDCDGQHPASVLPEMLRLWEQGFEVVEGVKESRGAESAVHSAAAKIFYRWISRATGQDMAGASDFRLLDRKVVDALNRLPERNVFFRALSGWMGFRQTTVKYAVGERESGESKWSTRALFRYAVTNIASFTSAPLHIVTVLGFAMLLVAVVFGVIALVQKIVGVALGGFTTVILLLLFIGSILMICLGIIGFYIARIYEEIKGRPRYIVAEELGPGKTE